MSNFGQAKDPEEYMRGEGDHYPTFTGLPEVTQTLDKAVGERIHLDQGAVGPRKRIEMNSLLKCHGLVEAWDRSIDQTA